MIKLKYTGEQTVYDVSFKKISGHIIQVTGDFPVKEKGFVCYREEDQEDIWDYTGYNTIYREIDEGAQFSNDGSVYVAPPEPEPGTDPEPYVPTLDEAKEMKKQEIHAAYQAVRAAGVDIEISTGTERFPVKEENITFLFGKQMEVTSGEKELISYQDAQDHCKFYSRADMQTIINTVFAFVDFQTSYRNNLYEWVDECQDAQGVEQVYYGAEIPEELQSEVYKSHLAQLGGGT